jgi:hypothetical protein
MAPAKSHHSPCAAKVGNAIAAASNPPRAAILRRWRRRASWRSARGEGARRARR